jgi:NAD-dependent deacetylase
MPISATHLAQAAEWMRHAEAITVLTGAGVSTDSGIPDFRGPHGLWTKDPQSQALFTLANYVADPAVRVRAWRNRRDHPAWTAEPNAAHAALVELERAGRLRALLTQNIDGLHQKAGSSQELVVELHGTVWQAECLSCGDRQPMSVVIARVDAGEEDPACLHCGGIVKSATVSFGQSLGPAVLQQAIGATQDCDLFLAVGTSLSVYPAAGLCDLAQARGARLVVVNAEPTPYDGQADAVLRDPIGAVLPALVEGLLHR